MRPALLELPLLTDRLPAAPPPDLRPALDAAARCFARYGVTRTSMNDIARELRVSRSTAYRLLGSVERAIRLLAAREIDDLIHGPVAAAVAEATGPEAVIVLLAEVVTIARRHPVLVKVLADEPEIIGPFLVSELPGSTTQVAEMLEPVLRAAMDAGLVARQDARALAGWLVRIAVVLILDPPDQPLRPLLEQLLLPALRGG